MKQLTHEEAQQYCAATGKVLARMDEPTEFTGAFYTVIQTANLQTVPLWVGQKMTENWASINYLTKSSKLHWLYGMPTSPNQPSTSDCIKRENGFLVSADCASRAEFFCEDEYFILESL